MKHISAVELETVATKQNTIDMWSMQYSNICFHYREPFPTTYAQMQ